MAKLMNFLPILGEANQGMKPFKVDTLLSHIKRAYAEKAVRTGFDDDSIYSDQLLLIKEEDLKQFNNLKGIIGTTKKEKAPSKFDVNHQGLDEEEYDTAEKARKKKKRERTQAEQDALDKVNELKKQRRTMISILRGISIRIPLMIYGMDIKFDEEVSINKFVNNIDDVSWKEFMPKGITKELFKQFIKYYDADVFIEAGKIIRQRVKDLDKVDPLDRVDKLAEIFATFRNPDKETVLTPWRVVNMHLGKTIGGLAFYDEDFKSSYADGKAVRRWIDTEYTDQVLNRDAHILEINAKTGLYPLYAATSIYWREFQKMNEETAGKFNFEDELLLWQKILRENIFVVAKTPMAKEITIRTLTGYHSDWISDVNAVYVENIVEDSKASVSKEADKIEGTFGNMKFDVVIGNPPYQQETAGTRSSQISIYHQFMKLSYKLSNLVTLITPARFLFNAGDTSTKFNQELLNNPHFKIVMYEKKSWKIFPNTDIKGGVAVSLYDKRKDFGAIKLFVPYKSLRSVLTKVKPYIKNEGSLVNIIYPANKLNLDALYKDFPEDKNKISSRGRERRLQSNIFKLDSIHDEKNNFDYGIYGIEKKKRTTKYLNKKYIDVVMKNNIENYKVLIPKSNGNGDLGEKLSSPVIGNPNICYTYTFIGIGNFKNQFEANATLKYIKTKFARAMLGILKVTQDNTPEKWKYIPVQDFTSNSDIDWTKSISEIDQQLYKKYNLSKDEIKFIETKVREMN